MAIHHFDLMRYILQREPKSISCSAWNPAWSHFTDPAAASACILFQDDVVVNYYGNWASTGPMTAWSGEWRIECERGEILWSSRGVTSDADEVIIQPLREEPYPLALSAMTMNTDWHGSLNAFVKAIASGQELESSGRNNLLTLALSLAAVEAANTHLPVEIASMLPDRG
jgi:predicted dehydrogenase